MDLELASIKRTQLPTELGSGDDRNRFVDPDPLGLKFRTPERLQASVRRR